MIHLNRGKAFITQRQWARHIRRANASQNSSHTLSGLRSRGYCKDDIVDRRRQAYSLVELLIVIEVILIIITSSVPTIISTRRAGNETSAIASLHLINGVEQSYRSQTGTYGTLVQLQSKGLIDPALGNASSVLNSRSGYYFVVVGPTSSQYWITGIAASTSAGSLQFYTDETNTIFQASNGATPPSTDSSGQPPNAAFTPAGN